VTVAMSIREKPQYQSYQFQEKEQKSKKAKPSFIQGNSLYFYLFILKIQHCYYLPKLIQQHIIGIVINDLIFLFK
jgi:hypothetical protein